MWKAPFISQVRNRVDGENSFTAVQFFGMETLLDPKGFADEKPNEILHCQDLNTIMAMARQSPMDAFHINLRHKVCAPIF
jgi:hypothetical protein